MKITPEQMVHLEHKYADKIIDIIENSPDMTHSYVMGCLNVVIRTAIIEALSINK